MEPFDPENDLIDKYLRGELHGQDLDGFVRQLERDPLLKQDIEFRRLLVRGINDYGSVQLKNYLRQRTQQKRVLRLSYKAWYFAAAAVGTILLVGVAVLMQFGDNGAKQSTNIASTENTDSVGSIQKNDVNKDKEIATEKSENTIVLADSSVRDAIGGSESEAAPAIPPQAVVIASNIPVVPIKISGQVDPDVTMKRKPGEIKTPGSGTSKSSDATSGSYTDSMLTVEGKLAKARQPQNNGDADYDPARYKLNFFNTPEGTPQISVNKNSKTVGEISVYNLPYDTNPQLLQYNSKYYLKTGTGFYEVNTNTNRLQNAVKISDPAIIKSLSK
jgi:hypothetical protein